MSVFALDTEIAEEGEELDLGLDDGECGSKYCLRRRRTVSADDAIRQRLGSPLAASSPVRKRRKIPQTNPALQPIGIYDCVCI